MLPSQCLWNSGFRTGELGSPPYIGAVNGRRITIVDGCPGGKHGEVTVSLFNASPRPILVVEGRSRLTDWTASPSGRPTPSYPEAYGGNRSAFALLDQAIGDCLSAAPAVNQPQPKKIPRRVLASMPVT